MTRLTITLPKAMPQFVEEQVASGAYRSPSEFSNR